MSQIETFHRGKALGSQSHFMPAPIYNEMLTLFHQSNKPCLFVPIRSMQYMAVIDNEEIIFVDSQRKPAIEFSWRKFNPQERNSLDDPVSYEFEYYAEKAIETMVRVQVEFSKAVHQIHDREHAKNTYSDGRDCVLPFIRKSD